MISEHLINMYSKVSLNLGRHGVLSKLMQILLRKNPGIDYLHNSHSK